MLLLWSVVVMAVGGDAEVICSCSMAAARYSGCIMPVDVSRLSLDAGGGAFSFLAEAAVGGPQPPAASQTLAIEAGGRLVHTLGWTACHCALPLPPLCL